jgi:thiol:disulfide interchange protein DsbC
MKKYFTLLLLASSIFTSSAQTLIEEVKDQELINRIQLNQPGRVNSVYMTELKGLYEVHTQDRQILYTDSDAKFFILNAQLVDFVTKTNFTQDRKSKTQLVPWDQLPLKAAFTVTKGNGLRKLAVFTDPDCPFCKRLENDLQSVDNVTISYFLLPIDSLHPTARGKSVAVWCNKDKIKAWNDLMIKATSPEAVPTCENPLKEIASFASSRRIKATPTIINKYGQVIEGYPKLPQLEAFISDN